MRILVVRMGAMGDIVHTLPAAASLRAAFPEARIDWLVEPRWACLLDGNPDVDTAIPLNRRQWSSVRDALSALRSTPVTLAVDFQGLIKSAAAAWLGGARRIIGFEHVRERLARLFYHRRVPAPSRHVVDRNLDLAEAAGGNRTLRFALPAGVDEGTLPEGPFVLANPLGGWVSKQWPLENYATLGGMLRRQGLDLVLNAAAALPELRELENVRVHASSIPGLIAATRRARAVVGIDSGPLHIAAALGKPGVAIFGPTDPERNGPYGGSFGLLRAPGAATTYRRAGEIHPSMRAIEPAAVFRALMTRLEGA